MIILKLTIINTVCVICYVVLASLPEVAVIQLDSHQPQQADNNKQESNNSGVFENINSL